MSTLSGVDLFELVMLHSIIYLFLLTLLMHCTILPHRQDSIIIHCVRGSKKRWSNENCVLLLFIMIGLIDFTLIYITTNWKCRCITLLITKLQRNHWLFYNFNKNHWILIRCIPNQPAALRYECVILIHFHVQNVSNVYMWTVCVSPFNYITPISQLPIYFNASNIYVNRIKYNTVTSLYSHFPHHSGIHIADSQRFYTQCMEYTHTKKMYCEFVCWYKNATQVEFFFEK